MARLAASAQSAARQGSTPVRSTRATRAQSHEPDEAHAQRRSARNAKPAGAENATSVEVPENASGKGAFHHINPNPTAGSPNPDPNPNSNHPILDRMHAPKPISRRRLRTLSRATPERNARTFGYAHDNLACPRRILERPRSRINMLTPMPFGAIASDATLHS